MENIELRSLPGKSERIARNIAGPGLPCSGSTRICDKGFDGDARSVELSSPPAIHVAHVSMRCAQVVTGTRKLYVVRLFNEHHERVG